MTGFPRLPEGQYRTPPGLEDRSWIYAYDANALADGADYRELVVPLEPGSDFLLRKVSGPLSVLGAATSRFQLRDNLGQETFSRPMAPAGAWSMAVVPEVRYAAGGAISFDLWNVLRNAYTLLGVTIFRAELAFHGVRRRRATSVQAEARCYQEKPFTYRYPVTINWPCYTYDAFGVPTGFEPPRRFSQVVDNLDFELYAINCLNLTPGAPPAPPASPYIMLYDANGRATSNIPVNINYVQNLPAGFLGAVGSAFSPPILYPVGSEIVFDLYSKYFVADLPLALDLYFIGVRRVPIRAPLYQEVRRA